MPDFDNLTKESIEKAINELLEGGPPNPQSTTYDLVYKGARLPPKVVIQKAFSIIGENVTPSEFEGGKDTPAFNRLMELGFVIKKKNDVEITEVLKLFVKDVKLKTQQGDTRTWYYPKKYNNYIFKASFGQSIMAKRPWLAIRKKGQKIQEGIYPAYLYYPTYNKILLVYGVSEKTRPSAQWDLGENLTPINKIIPENSSRTKCGYVHTVYEIQDHKLPDNTDFEADLASILEDYETRVIESEPDNKREETSFDDENIAIQKNTILYGPPGTGKTHDTVNFVKKILGDTTSNANIKLLKEKYPKRVEFVTFHQSFSYEDFIEGLRATTDENNNLTYQVESGVFKTICENVVPGKPSVIIIDEINRGNIASIFGELITLIEDTKRKGHKEELELTLPYSKESFSVPSEIYIVATMNTADRSLVMLDSALRRRFNFIEMQPNPSLLSTINGINCKKVLTVLNQRIEQLLDKEHTIGHSFFMKCQNVDDLMVAFDKKILPLLEEYFFDDFSKLNSILNGYFYEEIVLDTAWLNEEINLDESTLRKKRDIFKNPTLFSDALKDLYE